jgi:type II secretory pathway pseudopilin PulG
VIVLLAILAAVAAPRLGDITGTNAAAFADKLRTDIRYAQNLAMTQHRRYRVYFNASPAPAQGYAVVNDAGEFASDPAGGGNLSVTLGAGDYSGIAISYNSQFIEFDSLGVPYDGDPPVALTEAKSVTITGGSTSRTVTVQAQTGAVN